MFCYGFQSEKSVENRGFPRKYEKVGGKGRGKIINEMVLI